MAKPRTRKLKVYRTAIGFHDAYVAAPSQKAALEAWGSDVNLFARGTAEEVTDASLTREPLARPGEVVKLLRGTEAEQLRALGKGPAKGKRRQAPAPASAPKKRPPRPSRAAVDKAEAALERAEARHDAALSRLKAEEEALAKRRRAIEAKQGEERKRLERQAAEARRDYSAALTAWAED